MRDPNRIAVLVGLGLLFVVLLMVVPHLQLYDFIRPLRHVSPWVIFGVIWLVVWCRGGCCGRRRCGRRSYRGEAEAEV